MSGNPFEDQLRKRSIEIRLERGQCPPSSSLIRFAAGDGNKEVQEHVARCGGCDAVLSELRSRGVWWKRPLVAYGLASISLFGWFATIAIVQMPTTGKQSDISPVVWPGAFLDLNTTRGDFAIAIAKGYVVLSFTVPMYPDRNYRGAITNAQGFAVASEIPIRSHDGLGNCVLVLDSSQLPSGTYTLNIDDGAENHHYFQFRVG